MGDFIIGMANKLIAGLGTAITWAIGLLPQSPFQSIDVSPIAQFMPFINWLVPVGSIITIFTSWCACIAIYYVAAIVLRWLKVVGD